MKQVFITQDLLTARLVRGYLGVQGIPSVTEEEYLTEWFPLISVWITRDSDLVPALKIIRGI